MRAVGVLGDVLVFGETRVVLEKVDGVVVETGLAGLC